MGCLWVTRVVGSDHLVAWMASEYSRTSTSCETNKMNTVANDNPIPSFRLDDRLIIVTGSSGGIGRVFAEAFARAGAFVVLVSRRREKLEEVRQSIAGFGGRAEIVPADLVGSPIFASLLRQSTGLHKAANGGSCSLIMPD